MALDPQVKHIKMMKAVNPSMRMAEGEDFSAWQIRARKRLEELMGLPLEKAEDNFRIEWTDDSDPNQTEIRFLFESEQEVTVVCHLLLPKKVPQESLPLVICVQGHTSGFHISMGRAKYDGDDPDGGDRDFARQIIARGQAALAIEQRGRGERGKKNYGGFCYQPAVQAMMLGRTLNGERCWDISRTIDVVEKYFPMIDPSRIALMGNSGGGTVTTYAAALDTRIAAAMPSCAVCGYLDSIGDKRHCLCNYIPGVMKDFDMGDVLGLIAPRPCVVVNGQDDASFPLFSAKEQVEIGSRYYRAAGAEDRLEHVIGPEGHRFYADLSWPVFDKLTGWKE